MRLNDEAEKKEQRPRPKKKEKREQKGFDPAKLRNSSFRIKQK